MQVDGIPVVALSTTADEARWEAALAAAVDGRAIVVRVEVGCDVDTIWTAAGEFERGDVAHVIPGDGEGQILAAALFEALDTWGVDSDRKLASSAIVAEWQEQFVWGDDGRAAASLAACNPGLAAHRWSL